MKRMFLLVFTLLLVGGAGAAMADENPPPTETTPSTKTTEQAGGNTVFLPDLYVKPGDLVALGPLTPGKLREVCAVVDLTPKVRPEMTGVFCYPSTKQGTPARNGYINVFLAWGKLTAPGGGRWTGTKVSPWTNTFNHADYQAKGWTFWNPKEGWPLWQELARKNNLHSWPEPVFSRSQLQGRITAVIYGDPAQGPVPGGFRTGVRIGGGTDADGRPLTAVNCSYAAGRFALALRLNEEKRTTATCSGANLVAISPYPYYIYFSEPWGAGDVNVARYNPACRCRSTV